MLRISSNHDQLKISIINFLSLHVSKIVKFLFNSQTFFKLLKWLIQTYMVKLLYVKYPLLYKLLKIACLLLELAKITKPQITFMKNKVLSWTL
jgi:hypothetical protein